MKQITPIVENLKNEYRKKILDFISKSGKNQKDIAKTMNVHESYISKALAEKSHINLITMCRIADALDLDISINFYNRQNGYDKWM